MAKYHLLKGEAGGVETKEFADDAAAIAAGKADGKVLRVQPATGGKFIYEASAAPAKGEESAE